MVVVDLGVVQVAEQALVDDGPYQGEVGAVTAFEADADRYAGPVHGGLDARRIFGGQGDGLLDDEVLAGLRGGHGLVGVKGMGRADVDHVDIRVGQQVVIVDTGFQRRAELGRQGCVVMDPAGADGGDLRPGHGLERIDMRPGHPAEADDAYIQLVHGQPPVLCRSFNMAVHGP